MREPSAERENTLAVTSGLRMRRETLRVVRVRTHLRTGLGGGGTGTGNGGGTEVVANGAVTSG